MCWKTLERPINKKGKNTVPAPKKQEQRLLTDSYQKQYIGRRCDTEGMCRASSHNPKNPVGGIDQEKLALFFGKAVLVVGEEVADKLWAFAHAKGLEAVACPPMT